MTRSAKRRKNAGLSLFEVLVVIGITGTIITLGSQLFVESTRISAYTGRALDRVQRLSDVHRVFASTVRESAGIVSGVASYETGDAHCVLRMPSEGAADRFAVLGPTRAPDRFSVLILREASGGAFEAESLRTLPIALEPMVFAYGDAGEPAVTLRVEIKRDRGERSTETPASVFAATPMAGQSNGGFQ